MLLEKRKVNLTDFFQQYNSYEISNICEVYCINLRIKPCNVTEMANNRSIKGSKTQGYNIKQIIQRKIPIKKKENFKYNSLEVH